MGISRSTSYEEEPGDPQLDAGPVARHSYGICHEVVMDSGVADVR
jgi:hypothetical protein